MPVPNISFVDADAQAVDQLPPPASPAPSPETIASFAAKLDAKR